MLGFLYYASGADFDARREVWALRARVAAEQRLRGYMSAVRLLFDLSVDGFRPDDMQGLLDPTDIENILVFEDSGVRLAFNVPGNGRLPTPDIMLLAAELCALDRQARAATRRAFAASARHRYRNGERAIWPLVKSP